MTVNFAGLHGKTVVGGKYPLINLHIIIMLHLYASVRMRKRGIRECVPVSV